MPAEHLDLDHGAAWLQHPDTAEVLHGIGVRGDDTDPGIHHRNPARRHRLFVITTVAVFLTGSATAAAITLRNSHATIDTAATTSEATATTTPVGIAGERACSGLSGHTITTGPGDTRTPAGVVAAFEYAYYVERSAEAALKLVSPDAGLAPDRLAAAIAGLPVGTTHCVGITSIADNTTEVHLVELRPDGRRFDYLQLVNVAASGTSGLVITNIQKRGT